MAIPNTVANGMISGVIGEISHYGPTRVTAAVLSSADEKKNLFGRAYTYNDDSVESVQVGGDGAFAGIMINPKAYRIGEEYARNGTQGEFLTMGEINTEITAGVKRINAPVVFSPDDGSLSAKAKAEAGDLVIGFVSRHIESPESPHLCVIRLTEIPYTVAAKEGE
ncbi:structural cement protein Gp24 [Morganella morganii]|uniref:structural cement protein Gp24 n=1 Tax=Morganella morganii TaxID=582 RepID=UPI00339D2095